MNKSSPKDKERKKKEPDFLCSWDFCTSCIGYRKKNNLPMPKLRAHPSKTKQ